MIDRKLQILVVEDDDVDRLIIKKALKESGIDHDLFFAEDHERGKEATNGKEYDCIFLDYNLPGGTGLELLKTIKATGNTSPVIIVTSQSDVTIAAEVIKNGADEYIAKDFLTGDGIGQSIRFMLSKKAQASRQRELENQLKETQNQLSTVVANAPIIIFSLDTKADFILFEGKGLNILGIKKENVINRSLKELNDLPMIMEDYMQAMGGKDYTAIVEWRDKFFEIFYSPILDEKNNIRGVLGIASDITVHKLAEEKLTQAKQIAEDTAKIKEQFLANMSHEIRTPMNGIIGLTRILLNSNLTHEQLKHLQSIRTCSDNLLVIINDILDFSKIEAGKMDFESTPFCIDELANHTIELFQSKADEKSLSLILEGDSNIPKYVSGDPTRLSQILNNLVSNAIKFTEKGEVRMKYRLASLEKSNVIISFEVRDTGIGIPEKSLPTVFDSFTQASSDTTRKFGGTGLGLTIVKRLINLQNGDIHVKSKYGYGTAFTFSIPFAITSQEIEKIKIEPTEDLNTSHLRILVAEDNAINQMIAKKIFEDWNTHADFAENGAIAVDMLRRGHYDLIMMDIQMPEMDGYTATQLIRSQFSEPKRSTPIIAVTAHATLMEKQKCLDAKMDDYLSKPFEPSDLKKKILSLTKSIAPSLNVVKTHQVNQLPMKTKKDFQATENIYGTDGLNAEHAGEITSDYPGVGQKINLSYLKRISEGNEAFVIEMIEMFLNKTPLALEQMNECLGKQNWEELRSIAHRIKPSFAYIGMQHIQTTLANIESWSDSNGDKQHVKQLLNEVELNSKKAFEQLRQELVSLK